MQLSSRSIISCHSATLMPSDRSSSGPSEVRNRSRLLSHAIRTPLIACMLSGCFGPDDPSEASKWETKLDAPSEHVDKISWTNSYAKYRDNPSDQQLADIIRSEARKRPDDVNLLMALAIVERNSGNMELSENAFLGVTKINPNRAGALWNLGRFAQTRGDLAKAAEFYEKARANAPEAWQPIYSLSQLIRMEGRVEEAKALWRKAKSLGAGEVGKTGGMSGRATEISNVITEMEWD